MGPHRTYRKALSTLAAALLLGSCGKGTPVVYPELDLAESALLPKPREVEASLGSFGLDSLVRIEIGEGIARDSILRSELTRFLQKRTGWDLSGNFIPEKNNLLFWKKARKDRFIAFRLDAELLPDQPEGYQLQAFKDSILVTSSTELGLLWGLQTLKQLVPWKSNDTLAEFRFYPIPEGVIRDYPEWGYRGMMLDVSRHFFELEEVKALIDQLAFYKMNRLHLHLSDDQGWRLEIRSWPKLTEIGGASEVGKTEGGYYTQLEFRGIVEYARERGITVIPEFDMPGHTQAAVASYPELNGTSRPAVPYYGTRVGFSSLATRKEITYTFVDDLLSEVKPLVDGGIIHIGGDESAATESGDYRYFLNRIKGIADQKGIGLMGWEDIAVADIDSTTVAQYWTRKKNAEIALSKGARLVLSPASRAYLDMKYTPTSRYGLNWAGYIPLDSAYSWQPEKEFPDYRKSVLGIEAPLWSETITQPDEMEYLAFPRLLAYAELGWSDPGHKNVDDFKRRLVGIQPFLEEDGIDFFRSPSVNWK